MSENTRHISKDEQRIGADQFVSLVGAGPTDIRDDMSLRDWGIDVLIALVCFAFGCGQLYLASGSVFYLNEADQVVNLVPNAYSYAAVAFATLPLFLRRPAPWPMFLVVSACFVFVSYYMNEYSISAIGVVVATYTIARYCGLRHGCVAIAIALLAMLTSPVLSGTGTVSVVMRIENASLVVAGGLCGFAVRVYYAYLEQVRLNLEEAHRSKEELAARRVAEERVRIARDVHDITGHSLSAVAIQAAAAERLVDLDPQLAKESIREIRLVSKTALDEIRSMVGVLRGDDPAATAPAEGTERLGDVASYLQRAGVEVTLDCDSYDKQSVPAFVDMALYSLAREAATNTVRHASASHVMVRLESADSAASISYSDDGVGFDSSVLNLSDGHGMTGMAERAEALNGSFEYDSAPGRGFSMTATVPLEGARHD